MVDMYGPTPEEMKPGETYRVVEDKEHGGIRLEKVEPSMKDGAVVVLDLPPKVAYIYRIFAAILDNTIEGKILEDLENHADDLDDGYVLGEEVKAVCDELFSKKAAEKQ